MILQAPVPGGVELIVLLLVLLFNLAVIALVVVGGVALYRRWRGDGSADQTEVDALQDRVAELEAQVEQLRGSAEHSDEAVPDDEGDR
ncbi:preprotein translocase subunit TatA [Halolamina sp. CBA1230]|uniref:preprotein translocase subunit TatA n=1 Tax=Halolamina sp. CBA1230 TaxID=1853690 RepID=UPI00117A0B6D|nr:preprotein translocase subunit TatA [Halolamina sp. CBA1230]QKY20735.1 preprotein translocase subunit TatA [Halolamina sp. CBA1230]